MTRKTNQRRTNVNFNGNPNQRRVAWDDLRAMTPLDPYTDFSKPPVGYVLDHALYSLICRVNLGFGPSRDGGAERYEAMLEANPGRVSPDGRPAVFTSMYG